MNSWLLSLLYLASVTVGSSEAFLIPTTRQQQQQQQQHIVHRAAVSTSDPSVTSIPLPPAISIENLSCTHNGGETWQLQDVSYVLPRGAKVALIGRNGTGKSTLLHILAEQCQQSQQTMDVNYRYTGLISKSKDVKVAMVEQEPPMPSDVTVEEAILGITTTSSDAPTNNNNNNAPQDVYTTVRRYRRAVERAEQDPDEFTAASSAMDTLDGWAVWTKAEEVATQLRIDHLSDQPLHQLSGGERKRVALAAALVQEPDVLLLDEPTNFLSLAGVQWLANLLNQQQRTILMVTHDRAFLQEVADRILELDRGKLYEHEGSYESFLQAREARWANEDAALQAAKAKYRVELEWMRRQPQARESKSKARQDAFYKLEKATKPRPLDPKLQLESIVEQRRLGTKILSMRNVSLKFGERKMLDDFSYDFCQGDRICLAGANGIGKTTFTKLITGEQPPDSGVIELGETIVLGVYDQLGLKFDDQVEQQTVLEYVSNQVVLSQVAENAKDGTTTQDDARRLLRQFEFQRQRWNERVAFLSGGERRRLQLLSVICRKPNFLLLDEPSVDCDMDTLSALETFLQEFKGVLLIASHDRYFADKVADHLFVFEGNGVIKDFQGTLSEYASCLVEMESRIIYGQLNTQEGLDESSSSNNKSNNYKDDKAKRNEQRNFVRRAKKDMKNLEGSIEKLKTKAESIQYKIDNTPSEEGWSVLADLTDELNGAQAEIEEKELAWLELAEEMEAVGDVDGSSD